MRQISPTPWRKSKNRYGLIRVLSALNQDGDYNKVALIDNGDDANASAIVAAPDGIAFAQCVESAIVDGDLTEHSVWGPVLIQCRSYLSKAKGHDEGRQT